VAKVHFISLGCPKNRVDAEHMLGLALADGHTMAAAPEDADTIVVNTCSFIGEAKEESVETILRMGEVKKDGGQKLVVAGCLAQRYVADLQDELPEVDHFIGTADYLHIGEVLGAGSGSASTRYAEEAVADGFVPLSALTRKKQDGGTVPNDGVPKNLVTDRLAYVAHDDLPRVNSMPAYTAYLKIAEGCDNTCAFCIIPKLRGKQRSRPIPELVREAQRLAAEGTVEINLIAQDLTGYGHDLPERPTLADLLQALSGVEGIRWVRCMYAYPRTLSDALLHQLATGKNILPYLDIPVQHGSDRVLRRMKRGRDQKKLGKLLLGVRDKVPDVVLRSTVIVGFPGEADEDYADLVAFAEAVRFDRLGVFKYSDEEDTAAFDLDEKVDAEKIGERYDDLMTRQREVSRAILESRVGEIHEAIVEGISEEHEYLVQGRLWNQAPEIDGITYLSSPRALNAGEVVHVRITDAHDYDLVGEVLEPGDPDIAQSQPFQARSDPKS
jgi:ribosomal protein S12 methylthiotransferase